MRLTKIYTKQGDRGSTQLAFGESIAKDHPRIEAYGTIDELNGFLAVLKDQLASHLLTDPGLKPLVRGIEMVQNEMHDLGGELAVGSMDKIHPKQQLIREANLERLEQEIDLYNDQLPPLANFVLPGGHPANSWAHVCRTICRRAERRAVELNRVDPIRPMVIIYLNRLSDWLFVASRWISLQLGVAEILWNQGTKDKTSV